MIDVCRTFTFSVMIKLRLMPAILLFVFCVFYFFFPLPSCGLLEHFFKFHFDLSVVVFSIFLCIGII